MSIPELGTVRAVTRPAGRHHLQRHARALRRAAPPLPLPVHRLPGFAKELAIVADQGAAGGRTSWRARSSPSCRSVRRMDLRKKPGIAETLDWTAALAAPGDLRARRRRRRAHPRHAERTRSRRATTAPASRARSSRAWPRHAERRPRRVDPGRARCRRGLAGFAGFLRANGFATRRRGCDSSVLEAAHQDGRARTARAALEPAGAAVRPRRRVAPLRRACSTPTSCRRTRPCSSPATRRGAGRAPGSRRGDPGDDAAATAAGRQRHGRGATRREPRRVARVDRLPRPEPGRRRASRSRR